MSTEGSTGYSLGGPTAQGPAGYPIGYWLKRLDRAIEGALDPTLAAENLTRRHWQTLNLLHDAPSDSVALAEALRPFWGEGAITLDQVLSDLERRALVVSDAGRYTLRPRGRLLGPESPRRSASPVAASSTASAVRSISQPWSCCSGWLPIWRGRALPPPDARHRDGKK
jgi:hypothetical protein